MDDFKIVNKIPLRIDEYRERTGATKTWIWKQMGYNSRQAFDKAVKNKSNSLETYGKFAKFLDCKIESMFEFMFLFEDKTIEENKNSN